MSLGVFGGTFNPVHLAHLRLAEEVREALALERVLFVPAADPPHKDRDLAAANQRLEMVQLAIASNPSFEALDIELRRPGPSYSVDTLRVLSQRYAGETLWFLMGTDTLAELDTWHEPETFLGLTNIAVVGRPGSLHCALELLLPEPLAGSFVSGPGLLRHPSGLEIRSVPFPPLGVSASEIRRRVARGASIRYLVPGTVIDYIQKNRLYEGSA